MLSLILHGISLDPKIISQIKLKKLQKNVFVWDENNRQQALKEPAKESFEVEVKKLKRETLIDIGGNDGTFVRRIKYPIKQALVCDIDYNAVDLNYKNLKIGKETYMLPFIQDILNPTAAIGFNNKERQSFLERIQAFKPDVTLALAIIHHMTLSGNIPFDMSADFFASFSKYLIIEFPKRDDSWVQRLLSSKGEFQNHFKFYTIENFRKDYVNYFETIDEICIDNSERVLFLLRRKNDV